MTSPRFWWQEERDEEEPAGLSAPVAPVITERDRLAASRVALRRQAALLPRTSSRRQEIEKRARTITTRLLRLELEQRW